MRLEFDHAGRVVGKRAVGLGRDDGRKGRIDRAQTLHLGLKPGGDFQFRLARADGGKRFEQGTLLDVDGTPDVLDLDRVLDRAEFQ